jgi:hypothetical protein
VHEVKMYLVHDRRPLTFGSNDVKCSVGFTVNLNCPSLLSNRRRMELDEGILQ